MFGLGRGFMVFGLVEIIKKRKYGNYFYNYFEI